MKTFLIVLAILLVLGLVVGGKLIGVRNDLATEREAINAQFSQVDVVMQRRADLIPNLVSTVKGYARLVTRRPHAAGEDQR